MQSFLASLALWIWSQFHIITPWLPAVEKKEIPVVDYSPNTAPARFAPCEWLSIWDVWVDPRSYAGVKLRDDYSSQLDAYVKRVMSHPAGKRCFFEWHAVNSPYVYPEFTILNHPLDNCKDAKGNTPTYTDFNNRVRGYSCPWFDNGVKASYDRWKWLMTELKKRGLQIDYFSTENEQAFSPWSFAPNQAQIMDQDPRIVEFQKSVGIASVANTMDFFAHREDFIRLNDESFKRGYQAFVDGFYKPILEVYPNLAGNLSDYAKFYISPKFNTWEVNGWPMRSERMSTDMMVSNGTDLFYLGGGAFLQRGGNEQTGHLDNTPWQAFILSMNQAYAIRLSNPNKPFWPSMAQQSNLTWTTKELYMEHWRHLALLVDGFVLWGPQPNESDYKILTDLFAEMDPILSFADRKSAITQLIDWHGSQVKTCATANRKTVCRVTNSDGSGHWE